MTDLNNEDIELLSRTGAQVIHCPESNMKLASGICPISKLLNAGVNVGIGTDGAASNNDLNLFGELKSATLLAKINSMDPTALTASEALTLGTLGGAKALGMDKNIGTIEVGKLADLIAVDLHQIEMQPIHDVYSQLIYVNSGSHVTHSWIQGEQIMHERELLKIDQDNLRRRILKWQNKLSINEL
jgi:5-methylthioadenosine/S-adenosylhomocysteine deaminase